MKSRILLPAFLFFFSLVSLPALATAGECCPPAPRSPAPCAAAPQPACAPPMTTVQGPILQEDVISTCSVWCVIICMDDYYTTHEVWSDEMQATGNTNDACNDAKQRAYADAQSKIPSGLTEFTHDYDCQPMMACSCCQSYNYRYASPISCVYRATYSIRCCNGQLIRHRHEHPDRRVALAAAKAVAKHKAQIQCHGRIRCCWYRICRVRATAMK